MQSDVFEIKSIQISLQHFVDVLERMCGLQMDLDAVLVKNDALLNHTISALTRGSYPFSVDAGLLTLREVVDFYTNEKGELDTRHLTTFLDLVNNCERELRIAKEIQARTFQKTECMKAATVLGEARQETTLQKELRTKFVTAEEEEMSLTELQKLIEEEHERQKLLNDLAVLRSRRA